MFVEVRELVGCAERSDAKRSRWSADNASIGRKTYEWRGKLLRRHSVAWYADKFAQKLSIVSNVWLRARYVPNVRPGIVHVKQLSFDKFPYRSHYKILMHVRRGICISDALHLTLVLSTKARAKIVSINAEEALEMEGVVCVLDHRDVPGNNNVGVILMDAPVFAVHQVPTSIFLSTMSYSFRFYFAV